jgi:hypothetical protein
VEETSGSSMFTGGSRLSVSAKWRPLPTPRFAGGADGCCVFRWASTTRCTAPTCWPCRAIYLPSDTQRDEAGGGRSKKKLASCRLKCACISIRVGVVPRLEGAFGGVWMVTLRCAKDFHLRRPGRSGTQYFPEESAWSDTATGSA